MVWTGYVHTDESMIDRGQIFHKSTAITIDIILCGKISEFVTGRQRLVLFNFYKKILPLK